MLTGDAAAMADALRRYRAEFGVDECIVPGELADDFLPVMAELRSEWQTRRSASHRQLRLRLDQIGPADVAQANKRGHPTQCHQTGGQQQTRLVSAEEGIRRRGSRASSDDCRAVSTAPITVMPSRPDTSREALKMPDATPASARGMASRTLEVSGTVSPPPIPMTAKLGISDQNPASAPSRLTEAIPPAISSIATATTR